MRTKKLITILLVCVMACSFALTATAVREDLPGYVISGSCRGNTYTLSIGAENIFAWTGRIGIAFDTTKVTLQGGDSLEAFKMASGLATAPEITPESEMVSASGGFACLAWYGGGLNALNSIRNIATLTFKLNSGVTSDDIDASTFRLKCIEDGEFGPWKSAASFQGRGEFAPIGYEYLTNSNPMNVTFTYDGADKEPSDGYDVTFVCRSATGDVMSTKVTINGKEYEADSKGQISLKLGEGEYIYRAVTEGYGNVQNRLSVNGNMEIPLTYVTDTDLVRQAAQALRIGYASGDSAKHVTKTIQLPTGTDDGVEISWNSSATDVVTSSGLVYLPEYRGVDVKLTATLTRGKASETREFSIYVCSKEELRDPEINPKPPVFTDLAGYEWAADAINKLAAEGITKGTSDTTFSPGAYIKRGDFITLLMRMLGTTGAPKDNFDDVPAGSYYYDAIGQAKQLGIATGVGDNKFAPDAYITRQDMITLTIRAMKQTGYISVTKKASVAGFKDYSSVADYAVENMELAVGEGLIIGSDGRLYPLANTKRADIAVFLERIFSAHN